MCPAHSVHRPLLAVALAVAAIGSGCGKEARPSRDGAEALRALPYVHWSTGADPKLRGVVRHDRARAWAGVNLYTNDRDAAYLMDMDGRRLHTWRLPETEQ